MLRERIYLFKKLVFAADLCLVALALQVTGIINCIRLGTEIDIFAGDHLLTRVTLIWGAVLWFMPECYTIRLRNIGEILLSSVKTGVISSILIMAYIFVSEFRTESRFPIILFSILSTVFIGSFRLAIVLFLEYYRSRGYNYRTVLIIGTGNIARGFADKILKNARFGLKLIGFVDWEKRPDLWRFRDIPCIGNLNDFPEIVKNNHVDWAVFAVGKRFLGKIEQSLAICEQMGIQVAVLADFFPMKLARKRIDTFFDSPLVCYETASPKKFAVALKSFVDRILAITSIVLALPLLFIIAAAIKITSKGPVLYKQERCGLNGRKFVFYKFRTMTRDADRWKWKLLAFNEMDGAAFKMKNDPRVTSLGRLLRRTSFDELPQLFNILKGDMSFVGPRPPLAEELARYDFWHRRKLSVKPGLTCLWQVSGRSDIPFEQWMKLDLEYIDNWSLWEDAKILAKTVPAVLKGTGAR